MSTSLLALSIMGVAHASSLEDVASIKSMAGCFDVTFQYAVKTVLSKEYSGDVPYSSKAVEWVVVDGEDDGRVELQHVLVSGPAMIKHWRQIWTYEGTDVTAYKGHGRHALLRLAPADVAGKWTQVVTNVDDAPRYGCAGEWNTTGAGAEWSCTVDAPLPRRDKEHRHEYDILTRTNIHRIVADGWDHGQENEKVRLEGETRRPVAREVGHNTYRRIDDEHCAEAIAWWPGVQPHWAEVRGAWSAALGEATVDGRLVHVDEHKGITPLWVDLFWVAHRAEKRARSPSDTRGRAQSIIDRHVEDVTPSAMP
jgi:hypothetical protein